jgi:hypothetical protein
MSRIKHEQGDHTKMKELHAQVKKELHAGFKMTDLGLLHYYLGIEVFQRPHHIFISQSKYAT